MAKEKDLNLKQGTIIRRCDCNHEWQDKRYGKQMRVVNLCSKGKESRCTVCNKVVPL